MMPRHCNECNLWCVCDFTSIGCLSWSSRFQVGHKCTQAQCSFNRRRHQQQHQRVQQSNTRIMQIAEWKYWPMCLRKRLKSQCLLSRFRVKTIWQKKNVYAKFESVLRQRRWHHWHTFGWTHAGKHTHSVDSFSLAQTVVLAAITEDDGKENNFVAFWRFTEPVPLSWGRFHLTFLPTKNQNLISLQSFFLIAIIC